MTKEKAKHLAEIFNAYAEGAFTKFMKNVKILLNSLANRSRLY